MQLAKLEGQFVAHGPNDGYRDVDRFEDATGVMFLCPACFEKNGGPEGTHYVLVWFRDRGVPASQMPGPGRWGAKGTSLEDLTLTPSIDLSHGSGCKWHGFVTDGEAK
jgi:hypothetical protein